jgi:hypothetical protein
LKNLDIWKEAGHGKALKKTVTGRAKNGLMEISFPYVAAGQAVISAIAVASEKEGIAAAPPSASERKILPFPEDVETFPAITYKNIETDSVSKTYTFTITPGLAGVYALRFKYRNDGKETIRAKIRIISANGQLLRDDSIDFPPAAGKWKILNTTTGTQINAGKYSIIISGNNIENLKFDSLDVQ